MAKKFSRSWTASIDSAKQRKYRYNAPLHVRQKLVSSHLDKKLRKETGHRSIPLRKEDEVKVMVGEFRGKTGKVTRVDLKKIKVYVDNVKRKKVSGQEVEVPIDPSNLMVIKLNLDDKKRRKFVERKKK